MDTLEEFEQQLRDALAHLYDPAYLPPDPVWEAMGCSAQQGVEALRAALIRVIDEMKPAPGIPPTARIMRLHALLSCRYVQHLTQEEAAECLGISPRHLRREQQEAVHVLAQRLWGRRYTAAPAPANGPQAVDVQGSSVDTPETESLDWHSQVRRELVSLQKSAPTAIADVGETLRSVVKLWSASAAKHGVELDVGHVQPGLCAAIHRSALRQILIAAVGKLIQHMGSGQITLSADRRAGRAGIDIVGHPVAADGAPDSDLIQEIVAIHDGSIKIDVDGDQVSFGIVLPSVDEVTVLVVEDNEDLVHFYCRYTAGTRYRIVHAVQEKYVFEMVESSNPGIIVLDVMLPDVDGWELLGHLREHPATRGVPIIVCSVVREDELALDLGAALYLPKPVRRRQFIQALDQVLGQA